MIAKRLAATGVRHVAQVFGTGPNDARLAATFKDALVSENIRLHDTPQNGGALAVWGDEDLLQRTLLDPAIANLKTDVFASGSILADDRGNLPDLRLPRQVVLAWQYPHPGESLTRINRVRGWLRARQIRMSEWERTQLNTYFTLDLTEHALDHLVDRYSREFFLETIEQLVETGLNPGTFPRLSLGPSQRFAAHGSTILIMCGAGLMNKKMSDRCDGGE